NTNNFLSSSSSSSSLAAVSNNACRRDLSTDLKLGLSISPTSNNNVDVSSSTSSQREQRLDWPPIKALLRSTLVEKAADRDRHGHGHGHASLFVKVYMEGVPIGRKLDLLALDGYSALMTTLRHMFRATILCPAESDERVHSINSQKHCHLLTYQDKEGDWMMVGDVPWDVFLTTVKRLKITRADRC
ncbi:Auxin-responsive protein, partial [Melia azedarach]